jgi:hypothetical protein
LQLLETLDIIDDVVEQFFTEPDTTRGERSSQTDVRKSPAKPLRYEEYGAPSNNPSPIAKRKPPFQAKPRPSSIRSQLLAESNNVDNAEVEMRQSIAHLMLQERSSEQSSLLV